MKYCSGDLDYSFQQSAVCYQEKNFQSYFVSHPSTLQAFKAENIRLSPFLWPNWLQRTERIRITFEPFLYIAMYLSLALFQPPTPSPRAQCQDVLSKILRKKHHIGTLSNLHSLYTVLFLSSKLKLWLNAILGVLRKGPNTKFSWRHFSHVVEDWIWSDSRFRGQI